jgi:hypothetical protein
VFVVSHRAWTTFFGSDPQIVGKTIRFAGVRRHGRRRSVA